ncbi:MAG: hypothetical protein C5B49_09740, partial [Bdellovibrio sp.]
DEAPHSVLGTLAMGLLLRALRGSGPVTVLSCDNLSGNGDLLARRLRQFLADIPAMKGPQSSTMMPLKDFLNEHVSFPNTMVDRIVPAPNPAQTARLAAEFGVQDEVPLFTEPFRQWVIEDRFAGQRPPWELAGAQFVKDVKPFEEMKLRLLNGSHSLIAYLGLLMGETFVHEAINQPPLRQVVVQLMAAATATLRLSLNHSTDHSTDHSAGDSGDHSGGHSAANLGPYQQALLQRLANPQLAHRLEQIAADGSQKIPQRWLVPALSRRQQGSAAAPYALGIAGWIRAWEVMPERLQDPLAARIKSLVGSTINDQVKRVFSLSEVFPQSLAADRVFLALVAEKLNLLRSQPIKQVLAAMTNTCS